MSGVSEGRPEPRTGAGRRLAAVPLIDGDDAPLDITEDILAIEDEAGSQETPGLRPSYERLWAVADEAERRARTFITGTFDRTQEARARMALDELRALLDG